MGSTAIPLLSSDEDVETAPKSRQLNLDAMLHGIENPKSVAAAEMSIRLGFLRKVFGIVGIQLLMTTMTSAIVLLWPNAKIFVQEWPGLLMVGFIASLALLFTMMIYRHETPVNYCLMVAWTLVQAYTVAAVVTFYDVEVVVSALALTSVVTLSLFVFALQSKRDWSVKYSALYTALCILIVGSILQLVLMSSTFDFLLACAGALIFSMFIVVDIHLMMHHLSPEEYILASINLYLDIINLFLQFLRILQHANRG